MPRIKKVTKSVGQSVAELNDRLHSESPYNPSENSGKAQSSSKSTSRNDSYDPNAARSQQSSTKKGPDGKIIDNLTHGGGYDPSAK